MFLRYIDEHNKEWAYSSREETWTQYVNGGLQPTEHLLRCDNYGRCCAQVQFLPPSESLQQNAPAQIRAANPTHFIEEEAQVADQSEDSEEDSSNGSDEELSEASALASRQALANSSFTPLTQIATSQIINHPGMSPINTSFASPNKQYFIANGDMMLPMNPTQGVSIVEYPLLNSGIPVGNIQKSLTSTPVQSAQRKFVEQPVSFGRQNVPVVQYVRSHAQPVMSVLSKKRDRKKSKGKVCCNFI